MPFPTPQTEPTETAGTYNPEQWSWNPYTGQYEENPAWTAKYQYGDPANGTDVVTNLSEYNQTGQAQLHYGEGVTPYFGFGDSAQNYNAGDAPNSGMFISADPTAIDEYQSHRQDVVNQGVAQVGALVGGTALAGALTGGAAAGTTIGPNGLPTGAMGASGGGVGAMSGGIPGVGISPGLGAAFGSAGPGGGLLDSSGSVIPGTEGMNALAEVGPNGLPTGAMSAAGGGMGTLSGAVPAVGAAPGIANALGSGTGLASASDIATGFAGAGGGLGSALGDAVGGGLPNWITDALLPGLNSLLGANAADKAAEAQERAALASIEEQRRQYDQSRADLQPWLTAGQGALGRLQDPNAFQASPSYDFRRSEGLRGIENSFAAGGMGQSGNALKALADFNSGLASQEHGQWWNQQAGLAGVGQTAGNTLGQFGQNTAANVGNALQSQGDARASGYLGRSAAVANGLNDGMYNYLYRRQR